MHTIRYPPRISKVRIIMELTVSRKNLMCNVIHYKIYSIFEGKKNCIVFFKCTVALPLCAANSVLINTKHAERND